MREFTFRVRNTKTNKWVHGPGQEVNLFGEVILLGGFMNGVSVEGLNDCVALQYTGLKDKNGREIYEGDILRRKSEFSDDYEKYECVFKIKTASSGFVFENINKCWYHGGFSEDCEIIGNIYDTPELIK